MAEAALQLAPYRIFALALRSEVVDVDAAMLDRRATGDRIPGQRDFDGIDASRRPFEHVAEGADRGGAAEHVAVDPKQRDVGRAAEARGGANDRLEDRLDVGRRAGDRAQDLARRRPLLQRLREVGVARLELREQPHVLDGDDRLVGEGLEQLDVLVREHLGRAAADRDDSDEATVT